MRQNPPCIIIVLLQKRKYSHTEPMKAAALVPARYLNPLQVDFICLGKLYLVCPPPLYTSQVSLIQASIFRESLSDDIHLVIYYHYLHPAARDTA